ncbi:class I SAM-dependent methyltransferase [Christensenellaceae bacterium OttesenSCG-928-K19]|nr:class I SAM-dependent methyltransferase [Christensenellaceae bacterium OttesenSCG-928-K19]
MDRIKNKKLAQYVDDYPSQQVAADLFKGQWSSSFPASAGVTAGPIPLFEDSRINWAVDTMGSPEGKTVLELGFLEGGHSYMMSQMGAASVTAIDANTRAYLRALVAKEIMGMPNVHFYCGDFNKYLAKRDKKFDILLCSGILYHMVNPVQLIADMAACADNLFIWTHYYDHEMIYSKQASSFRNKLHFSTKEYECSADGYTAKVFRRSYLISLGWAGFCGGPNRYSYWLPKEELIGCLKHFGFRKLTFGFEEPGHKSGPSLAVVAQK